ncbi:alcohol dehydrogenase [Cordyceps javanica]|uniref:Alcohol dehydrogenase n=1 Tax=Cordyceps javanica TaxID=43265 RepID=A0A545ULL0_9HYPO|nr:alcohol dehydrogenase [Cordyceps javanica]
MRCRYNMFNPQFPAVLGFTYAGTFTDVGPDVSYVAPGDRVAVARWGGTARETRYAAFQKYPLALERNVLKLDAGTSFEDGSGVIANLVAVVSALTIHMGLEKPSMADQQAIGGLAVRFASDAEYEVVTTSSPANEDLVRRRNPASIINHRQAQDVVIRSIREQGPFHAILEATGTERGTEIMGKLLEQTGGGGVFFSTSPSRNDSELPANVTKRCWSGYSEDRVSDNARSELRSWFLREYLLHGLQTGAVFPNPASKIEGGLSGVQAGLDLLNDGKVSGVRLVVYPQE